MHVKGIQNAVYNNKDPGQPVHITSCEDTFWKASKYYKKQQRLNQTAQIRWFEDTKWKISKYCTQEQRPCAVISEHRGKSIQMLNQRQPVCKNKMDDLRHFWKECSNIVLTKRLCTNIGWWWSLLFIVYMLEKLSSQCTCCRTHLDI